MLLLLNSLFVSPLLVPTAHAADDGLLWAGAAGDSGLSVSSDGVSALVSQVEFDVQAAKGPLYFRLDLDVHVDPNTGEPMFAYPLPPEEAFLQIGRGKFRLKAGVSNPAIGLSAWDSWDNYYPTTPVNFDLLCGQVLGGDVGYRTDSGWEFAAFGGQDLAWGTPVFGAYVTTEQDLFSTWTGVNAFPALGHYSVQPSIELYPADWLWVDLDGAVGLIQGKGYAAGQLVANFFPESQPNPVLRFQKTIDPKGATSHPDIDLDLPDTSVSFILNVDPADYLRVSGEGRVDWNDGYASGKGILYVAFHAPGPDDDYSTLADESAEE